MHRNIFLGILAIVGVVPMLGFFNSALAHNGDWAVLTGANILREFMSGLTAERALPNGQVSRGEYRADGTGILRAWGATVPRTWEIKGVELGGLFSHQWNVGGGSDEPDTSISSLNYFYAFNLGGGLQFASGPTITYDWEADSGNRWTVPLGVGLSKTFIKGGRLIKTQLQLFYNVEQPDAFAQEWGVKLTITPVVKNPFIRK